jgi:hypothetical protein
MATLSAVLPDGDDGRLMRRFTGSAAFTLHYIPLHAALISSSILGTNLPHGEKN